MLEQGRAGRAEIPDEEPSGELGFSQAGSGCSAQATAPARSVSYAIYQNVPWGYVWDFSSVSWLASILFCIPRVFNFDLFIQ